MAENINTEIENKEQTYQVTNTNMPAILHYELIIQNGDTQYVVDALEGVKLSRASESIPAKLDFKIAKDGILDFKEGNTVQFSVNGEIVFKGFVFEKEHSGDFVIRVIAYDQMRYLKNKDCYVYYDKTATDLIKDIANDYGLTLGDIANTQYKIPRRIEDNKTLVDIINTALSLTLINTKIPYYLYDDAGKLTLKAQEAMKTDIYIDNECLKDYSYKTSIDKDTYNMVKVVREAPGEIGKALVNTGVVMDKEHIKEWGRLQYLIRPDDKTTNAMERAKNIMLLKNRKTREIRLKNVIGDVNIRGGSTVFVDLNMGDMLLRQYMVIQNVTHNFNNGFYSMDLDLMYVEKPAQYEVTLDNDMATLQKIQETQAKNNQNKEGANGYTYNSTADSSQVDKAFEACAGRVSPYGSVGCVDTVCATGSYYNSDLKDLYSAGVADTGTLCTNLSARGYSVEPFNGYANKGDILLYGDRDHAVIADGVGGCFGNSSSLGYAKHYSDANYAWANGSAPTEIIRMS